jgi:hypothetical protein
VITPWAKTPVFCQLRIDPRCQNDCSQETIDKDSSGMLRNVSQAHVFQMGVSSSTHKRTYVAPKSCSHLKRHPVVGEIAALRNIWMNLHPNQTWKDASTEQKPEVAAECMVVGKQLAKFNFYRDVPHQHAILPKPLRGSYKPMSL